MIINGQTKRQNELADSHRLLAVVGDARSARVWAASRHMSHLPGANCEPIAVYIAFMPSESGTHVAIWTSRARYFMFFLQVFSE